MSKQSTNISSSTVKRWLLKSAPEAGSGLNVWLPKGARIASDLESHEAHKLIMEVIDERGGAADGKDERAVWRAINKVHGTDYAEVGGTSEKKWPDADLGLIEELTLLHMWDIPGALATLESKSPDTLKRRTTGEIVRRLFRPHAYIATGYFPECTTVTRTNNEHLHKMAFLVPNPMKGLAGKTQEGKESGRCLDNVKHRRFLVIEFDFKCKDKQGNPTKWVPLIDLWESNGMSTLVQ